MSFSPAGSDPEHILFLWDLHPCKEGLQSEHPLLSLVLLETSCTYLLYSLECGVVRKLTKVDITGKTTS